MFSALWHVLLSESKIQPREQEEQAEALLLMHDTQGKAHNWHVLLPVKNEPAKHVVQIDGVCSLQL